MRENSRFSSRDRKAKVENQRGLQNVCRAGTGHRAYELHVKLDENAVLASVRPALLSKIGSRERRIAQTLTGQPP